MGTVVPDFVGLDVKRLHLQGFREKYRSCARMIFAETACGTTLRGGVRAVHYLCLRIGMTDIIFLTSLLVGKYQRYIELIVKGYGGIKGVTFLAFESLDQLGRSR